MCDYRPGSALRCERGEPIPWPEEACTMIASPARPARGWLSLTLLAFGAASLAFYAMASVNTWRYQRAAKAEVEQMAAVDRQPEAAVKQPDVATPPDVAK